jgi:hypothetical protein
MDTLPDLDPSLTIKHSNLASGEDKPMRYVRTTTDKKGDRTARYSRSSSNNNQGFGDSEYIDVLTRQYGHRSFNDDQGERITNPRRCATIRKTLGLGD